LGFDGSLKLEFHGGREPRQTMVQTPKLDMLRKIADDVRRQRSLWEIPVKK